MSETPDKIVSVLMRFGADAASAQKAAAEVRKIRAEIAALEKDATDLKKKISAALDQGSEASQLQAALGGVEKSIEQLRAKAQEALGEGVTGALEDVADAAQAAGQNTGEAFNLRDIGEKLNFVSTAMTGAGQAITGQLNAAVAAYMAAGGQYSAEGARWQQAQDSMNKSYERIGAVALNTLTPYMEQASRLLDDLATLIEENPELVGMAAGLAGALTAGGALVGAVAQVAMLVGSLQGVAKLAGAAGIAVPAGTGAAVGGAGLAAGVYGAAAISGGLMGKGLGNAVNAAIGQEEQSWGDILRSAQQLNATFSGLGLLSQGLKSVGFEEAGDKVWTFVKSINGLGEKVEETTRKTDALGAIAGANVAEYMAYEKQRAEAAGQYADQVAQIEQTTASQRVTIMENFSRQATQMEAAYTQERAKALRDYNTQVGRAVDDYNRSKRQADEGYQRSRAEAERDYYRTRSEAAKTYGTEVERMEADHQRAMLQMQEDHGQRVADLAAAGDALGLVKEQRAYDQQRGRAEGDYSIEAKRKNEDYAKQMADMERSFTEARAQRDAEYARQQAEAQAQYDQARAQRAQDFATQLADRAEQHTQQMDQAKKDRDDQLKLLNQSSADQLAKLREAYDKQTRLMQTAFVDRINAMSKTIQGSTKAYIDYMKTQVTQFEQFLRQHGYTGAPVPGLADGGPVVKGRAYKVGERGTELFIPRENGSIVPAGLTAAMLAGAGGAAGGRFINLRVETPSLTLNEVMAEVERRFEQYDHGLSLAFGV